MQENDFFKETNQMIFDKVSKSTVAIVRHIFIYNWIDRNAIPSKHAKKVLDILKKIGSKREAHPQIPIAVHCSAGIGRTGTLIALFNIYRDFLEQKKSYTGGVSEFDFRFNVWNVVKRIRHCRSLLVQTSGQYQYLYQYIAFFYRDK